MRPKNAGSSAVRLASSALLFAVAGSLTPLRAAAWGNGVFDVGASLPMPARPGGFAYLEYGSMDQDNDWSGGKRASYGANADKDIRSDLITGGVQYMLDRSWGYMFEVPVVKRRIATTDQNGVVGTLDNGAVGDIGVRGVYSGFSPDMSSGLTFGLKLPTGPLKTPDFARDAQIGTGSTDLLLGAYHTGRVQWGYAWFSNAQWDEPMLDAGGYRPGAEIDAALGASYDGWSPGGFKIAPLAQVLGAVRWRDIGATANPGNSGYQRVLLSPGLRIEKGVVRVYGDVEFPAYQFVNGYQLVASDLYKLNVGWSF